MEDVIQVIFAAFTTIMTSLVSYLFYKLKKREDKQEELVKKLEEERKIHDDGVDEALRALCRDRILQGWRYFHKHEGITTRDLETMTKLNNAYHKLGGNGTTSAVYDKILELPLKESD